MRKSILKIYGVISLMLIADLAAYYFYKIGLNGYYSDITLFWLWIFSSIMIVILFWKRIMAKLLLAAMVLVLVLSILPMALPFYTLMLSTTSLGLKMDKDLGKNYRAQIVGYSVMGYPVLQVTERKGIFEKQIFQCNDNQLLNDDPNVKIRDAKDIILDHQTQDTLTLTLRYGIRNKSFTFDKKTGNIVKR
ncbi:hypothetical protein DBR11_19575 [Pedobacter sp. HMWF019]|nr:hypothetical protein DBR11_19575 [Pedobacter sp. HMWF019]